MQNEADVLALIAGDTGMMAVLAAATDVAAKLELPDCWIGAGFVRRKVWDHLHGYQTPTPLDDIDVLYFQPGNLSQDYERRAEAALHEALPEQPWSAKNQARMHLRNGDEPYRDTTHAMHFWLETPTCIAVRLTGNGHLELAAPYGLDDLLAMVIRPTPAGYRRAQDFRDRVAGKNWLQNWPKTQVIWP